ncbi:MAG: hypothetical protein GX802_05020 [Clostridiales bacterium]|nr:hypothetical protein [Clostridiales bacterium]
MGIRLDKHLPDRSKEKGVTIWKLAIWVVIAIILIVTIPKAVSYIKNSIANTARAKAEKSLTLFMLENGASVNDYTAFVVSYKDKYYVYWYVDAIKALAGFDELSGFQPPIKFPEGMEYPLTINPFCTEYQLNDNGAWEVLTSINAESGFESCFEADDAVVTFWQFDTKTWREKPPTGVCIITMSVNGDSIKATRRS